MMETLLTDIAKVAPVVALMVVAIYYFLNKEKAYKKEIDELNAELRKSEKETLQLMSQLTTTLDKFIENDSASKNEIINEIRSLKEILASKIDSIK